MESLRSNPRTLLVIGVVEHREFALNSFVRSGYRVVTVDQPSSSGAPFADRAYLVSSLLDVDEVTAVAALAFEREEVSGVVTFYDELVPLTHDIARRAHLPALSEAAARAGRDKAFMRELLSAAHVRQPKYRLCASLADALVAASELRYPLAVKPTCLSGSIGVSQAEDDHSLAAAVHRAQEASPAAEQFMVEQWLPGDELDVEAITQEGETTVICVTRGTVILNGPHPVWTQMFLPDYVGPEIQDVVARTLAALDIDNSLSMTQMKVVGDHLVVGEVNPRTGGGPAPEMIALACGVNTYDLTASIACGARPVFAPNWRRFVAAANLLSSPGGVGHVSGLDDTQRLPGICQVVIDLDVTWQALAFPDRAFEERGYVVAEGDTLRTATEAACRGRDSIRLSSMPGPQSAAQ